MVVADPAMSPGHTLIMGFARVASWYLKASIPALSDPGGLPSAFALVDFHVSAHKSSSKV